MFASETGSFECMNPLLLELKMQNKDGNTALMYAASNNQHKCIKLLKDEIKT